MIDRHTEAVLEYVNGVSPDGAYKILSVADVVAALPEKYGINADGLGKVLESLAAEDLVSLKYADAEAFCVASAPKGRLYTERKTDEQKVGRTQKKMLILSLVSSAVGAFIGALTAILCMLPLIG